MRLATAPHADAPAVLSRRGALRHAAATPRRCVVATAATIPEGHGLEGPPLSASLRVEWAARWAAASLTLVQQQAAAAEPEGAAVASRKAALLRLVAPLDRGAAATPSDRQAVDAAVAALEFSARNAPAHLNAASEGTDGDSFGEALSGVWRLVYSSTFAGDGPGSQGFTGAPGAGTPLRLLGVAQRVSWRKRTLDNVVELRLPAPFPLVGGITVVATLAHTLEATGGCGVRIEFTELQLRTRGVKGARPLQLPSPLRALGLDTVLPPSLRGGAFETTFMDGEARISRGDRGETRVFVRG